MSRAWSDAKYYRERESERTPSLPVKRMIADLALLGRSYGVLLFAFHAGTSGADETAEGPTFSPQRLSPTIGTDQTLTPQEVAVQQLRPALNADRAGLQLLLRLLLDDVRAIAQPRTPASPWHLPRHAQRRRAIRAHRPLRRSHRR